MEAGTTLVLSVRVPIRVQQWFIERRHTSILRHLALAYFLAKTAQGKWKPNTKEWKQFEDINNRFTSLISDTYELVDTYFNTVNRTNSED